MWTYDMTLHFLHSTLNVYRRRMQRASSTSLLLHADQLSMQLPGPTVVPVVKSISRPEGAGGNVPPRRAFITAEGEGRVARGKLKAAPALVEDALAAAGVPMSARRGLCALLKAADFVLMGVNPNGAFDSKQQKYIAILCSCVRVCTPVRSHK
jgi:hypothetical protein